MKYSEAEKQIKALSSKYDIKMNCGDFNVVYNGSFQGIYVSGSYEYGIKIGNHIKISNLPCVNKLYMILSELAMTPLDKRVEEKKYYVKICGGSLGYLNIKTSTNKMIVDSKDDACGIKTKFTDKAIKQLKQRDDIPLDWNKVHFEEAE